MCRLLVSMLLLVKMSVYVLPLVNHLSPGHPCTRLKYRTDIDLQTVQGTWYVLAIICSSWNRIPLCDRVELHGNSSTLHETWSSLDLLEDPRHRQGAIYITDLKPIMPGVWRDMRPDRAYPITLVLDAGDMLVLAKCYTGEYATPYHQHEIFVMGRGTQTPLLDYTLRRLVRLGVDVRETQVITWSMCPQI